MMDFFSLITTVLPYLAIIISVSCAASVVTTWLRIKNGYPLETGWGKPIHPRSDKESMERIKLLTSENAQLRAELGSVKDRLENIERIVTDRPSRLAREIESLALDKGGNA